MSQDRRRTGLLVLLVAAVALLAGGLWWWLGDREGRAADGAQETEATAPVDRGEALRHKREAREAGLALDPVGVGGRVTRASDGTGIAGAVVLLSRKGIIQGQAPAPGEPSRPLTAITDANGSWQIDGVEPGRYLISATAAGFLPGTRTDVQIRGGQDQRDVNLALRVGGHLLSGTITDIGGGPIEGVLLRVQDASGSDFGFKQVPLAAFSDEDGRYAVPVADGRYALSTVHADYVGATRLTEVRDGPRVEHFELIPGGTIEGVVLARPEGKPVAGAVVSFADSRNGEVGGFTTNISFDGSTVITDDEGRFRLRGLRAGVVSIRAGARGFASPGALEVAIGIGEQVSDVELWVDQAYTLSGFVVPKGDPEQAVEGVLVGAWQLQPPSLLVSTAPSASDGYFEIVGVPAGTWQIGAIGEDRLPTLTGATAVVRDADITDLLIELDAGVRIRGRVDPARAARVRVRPNPEDVSLTNIAGLISDGVALAVADEDGVFDLGPLQGGGGIGFGGGGRKLTLVAEDDAGYRGELEIELGGEDLEGVVIPMTKGAAVSGTVLDQNGVPQAGVVVSVTPAERPEGTGMIGVGGSPAGEGAPTGEDGRFAVRGLDVGKHLVLVKDSKGRALSWAPGMAGVPGSDPGSDPASEEVEPIELDLEDTVNERFLDLRVVPRDGVIEGQVLDGEGLPVADAWVTASLDIDLDAYMRSRNPRAREQPERLEGVVPEDDEGADRRDWTRGAFFAESPVLTDENGFFVVDGLRRDRGYNLVAEGDRGGARATADAVSPGGRVTLILETLGGIDGVVRSGGKAVRAYTLEAKGAVGRHQRVDDPKGEFHLDRLDPGTYELIVTADAGSAVATVELGAEARERVELRLDAWGKLEGQIVGMKDGEAMAGLAILVNSESGAMDASAGVNLLTGQGPRTDRKGRFVVETVPPGKGTVVFMDPDAELTGGSIAAVEYDLEAGATLDLGTIEGVQTDEVPKDERGSLQLRTQTAIWAKRPRPPGTKLDEEGEDGGPDPAGDPTRERLWVRSLEIGGVAEQAGLLPGDEILSIDGRAVEGLGAGTAAQMLASSRLRVGQEVRLELRRGDDRIDETLKAVRKDAKGAAGTQK